MSYRLKRIDPFWIKHPGVLVGIVGGGLLGLVGFVLKNPWVSGLGGVVVAGAILAATKPLVSAVTLSLGLFGGFASFVLVPNVSVADFSAIMRGVSVLIFAAFYMVLMDALVLVLSVLYNFFSGVAGLGGLTLDFEAEEEGAAV
ncbi:MAG: hypothetical protein HY549_12155 [Elusimicrobia bacterium]|nr:hypothetical protein [Elusimicrobiota bacterium]